MANKSFSRGIETLGAEASLAFVGNTQHTLPYMLRHSDLFAHLPDKYYDSAFLDRLHLYVPGWEMDIIRSEMFTEGYGFVVDYLAEILRHLRDHDYSQNYTEHFRLMSNISTRDRTSIQKTFSGLMKLLYPHREATKEEIEEILRFAIEGRKRIKDQLLRIDSTYAEVNFAYTDLESGQVRHVKTLEEKMYPRHYGTTGGEGEVESPLSDVETAAQKEESKPREQHLTFEENERGVSFDDLFGPYLEDASEIVVTDPYIRLFFQARNMMEFLETVASVKDAGEEVSVHLVTSREDFEDDRQEEYLKEMQTSAATIGVHFTWEYEDSGAIHARHIVTDTGWKILLDRGLDIFQRYEMNDAFAFANRMQEQRAVKAFEVTYLRVNGDSRERE
jgi:ATP-dependent Lon protease